MKLSRFALGLSFLALSGACGGGITEVLDPTGSDPTSSPSDVEPPDPDAPLVPASKVDILFVVDDSASMMDKTSRLAASVDTLVRTAARVGDVHVGVIGSSLGSFGGDVCPEQMAHMNGRAHLRPAAGTTNGVLAYSGGDVDAFVENVRNAILGVGELGCGLEAQLESAYRFLVQPDPWWEVRLDERMQASLFGLDTALLEQRRAFLRPDSALVVVMITDEDDSAVDPLAIDGQGWAFMAFQFPGSHVTRPGGAGTTAPRGSSACLTDPASPACTSCGFQSACDPNDAICRTLKEDPHCQELRISLSPGTSPHGIAGYYGPTEDPLAVRFHHMKQRFGVDPQFPIARYVRGFTASKVPSRAEEHVETWTEQGARRIAEYRATGSCTNPIFAASLPSQPNDELCALVRGPRSRELVLFAVIGGVPDHLVRGGVASWTAVLGNDPDAYDEGGIDPHMIASTTPRPGLAPPSTPDDPGPDPVHGREWTTKGENLQFACRFQLSSPRECDSASPSCPCAEPNDSPLCNAMNRQLFGGATPSLRPLRVAKALGARAVVGSVCAPDGYGGALSDLAARLDARLVH